MSRVIDADDQSFSAFYAREFGLQVRRAALLLGSSEVAHDVVQAAFVGLYRSWGTLEHPGGYLNRSVLNGCRDVTRRRGVQARLVVRLVERGREPDRTDLLDDVLGALSFNQRAAVVLRYYGGFTTAEIAEALGCAPGSVGPWIDRALSSMRKALQ